MHMSDTSKPSTDPQFRISISLTQEQFDTLADAAEWVSRFLSGQIDELTLPAGLRFSDRYRNRSEDIASALRALKGSLFPELELSGGEFYGVGRDQTTEPIARDRVVLYEVYRTMLEYRTQQQIKRGTDMSHSVYSYPGLNYTGLPKPLITDSTADQSTKRPIQPDDDSHADF